MRALRPSELRELRAMRGEFAGMAARLAALEARLAEELPIERIMREAEERMRAGVAAAVAREVERQLAERLGPPSEVTPPPPSAVPLPISDWEDQDEADEVPDLVEAVARVRERKAKRIAELPKIDWARVADAHERAIAAPKPCPAPRPLPVAMDREGCRRCGIPGSRGCDHQLPYEPFT